MKITGELLKSERTQKNLTVQDVAFALKLSSKIITALEAGQIDKLPAKTFIRGFVKSYAQYLKIDVDQVMNQFHEEMGSTHPLPKNAPPLSNTLSNETSTASTENKSKSQNQKTILNESKNSSSFVYIGLAVVLVIMIVVTNRIIEKYQKETIVDHTTLSQVEPLSSNQTNQVISANTASTDSTKTSQETASSQTETKNQNQPANLNEAKNTTVEAVTTTPKTALAQGHEEGFEPSSGKPIEVIIEAKKELELMYARGNTRAFSRIKLAAKQIQVIRSSSGLYLKSEDGGSFHLVVNGIEKGQAGPNNKPIKLSF